MRNMLVAVTVCVFSGVLAGCAGSPIGDAIAGPEKLAQQDDAYCRSIGAEGSAYTNCRLLVSQQRDARHTARLGMAMGAMNNITVAPSSGPVTCTTTGLSTMRTTTCQ